jgi:hypothetical protein
VGHALTLIRRHVRRAKCAALSADVSLLPVLRPFLRESSSTVHSTPFGASAWANRIHSLATKERAVTLGTILLIVLVLMLIGAIPRALTACSERTTVRAPTSSTAM